MLVKDDFEHWPTLRFALPVPVVLFSDHHHEWRHLTQWKSLHGRPIEEAFMT